MGLFDFLKKGSNPPPPAGAAPLNKKIAGHAKVVGDKRAQTYDRAEAIQALADARSADAAAALLRRFTFSIDPSITDQEEKESAFQGIVGAGPEVVPAVRAFCARAEVLTWPLKILRVLLDDATYNQELLALAETFDTEYSRNVEPKLQVVSALAEVRSEPARKAVERFLSDVNETVRFHAVASTFAQDDEESVPALLEMIASEESVRIKNKVAEGLSQKGWRVPEADRDKARASLQDAYEWSIGPDGALLRRG
jgi:HEAT repeat protein